MNHRYFENLLLSDQPLPNDQKHSLRDHLAVCESCAQLSYALSQVEQEFRAAPQVGPAAGFVERWQSRVESQQSTLQRRQAIAMLAINLAAASALLVWGINLLLPSLGSPVDLVSQFLDGFIDAFTSIKLAFGLSAPLLRNLPNLVPLSWWISLCSSFLGLLIVWANMLKQYVFEQGVLS